MLVSCTVGKNAALPEPSSPDSTPQWRTLSLRVSERYPAESPVALFNCPADGLPVPPQVSTGGPSCFTSAMLGHGAGTDVQGVVRQGRMGTRRPLRPAAWDCKSRTVGELLSAAEQARSSLVSLGEACWRARVAEAKTSYHFRSAPARM